MAELQFISTDSNHYTFTGKERDSETGLDYFGARYYESTLGRWITPDWSAKPAAVPYAIFRDPQSLNLYTYVRNLPTILIDTDGHETLNSSTNMKGDTKMVPCDTQQCRDFDEKMSGFILGGFAATLGGALTGPRMALLARSLWGLYLARAAAATLIIGGAIEAETPGPSGTLTIARFTKLSGSEINTGIRLAQQTNKAYVESSHVGADLLDAAGRTYALMGGREAFKNFGDGAQFLKSILRHVLKSVDKVPIDLQGASQSQIQQIQNFVKNLTKEQQDKVMYVH